MDNNSPNVNSAAIGPEDYFPYQVKGDPTEMRMGLSFYEEEVGLSFETQKCNVLMTLDEGGFSSAIRKLPTGTSIILPVIEAELPETIALLETTHRIRVWAPGDVKGVQPNAIRRIDMASVFVKPNRPGKDKLRFAAAGFLAKSEEFFASTKDLVPVQLTKQGVQQSWPLVAELYRGVLMRIGEGKEDFEDFEVLEWLKSNDAKNILKEFSNSSREFIRDIFLPDEDEDYVDFLRKALYRSLVWLREYRQWSKENFKNPPNLTIDPQELRQSPTALLLVVPPLGITTPAWFAALLTLVYTKLELELLEMEAQAGLPVIWITREESLKTGLTSINDLLTNQIQKIARNTSFLVLMRKEYAFSNYLGEKGLRQMFDNVGFFFLDGGLGHILASYLSERLGNTMVTLESRTQSTSIQHAFLIPSAAGSSTSESLQPQYPAATLMRLVDNGKMLLVINARGVPSSGKLLPLVDRSLAPAAAMQAQAQIAARFPLAPSTHALPTATSQKQLNPKLIVLALVVFTVIYLIVHFLGKW